MNYTFVNDYKNNNKLRKSFNELTEKIFDFNFVSWYENGFWKDKYIPYSLIDNEKVVANVSVNIMDFIMDGVLKHYIQIGTVMTDKDYRGQGLSRYLMNKVIDEYKDKVDGIYLFGGDDVINFYLKFGFTISKEYQYKKMIYPNQNIKKVRKIDTYKKKNWRLFYNAIKNSVCNDRFHMDNIGLVSFWTMGSDLVYYLAEEDAYIIAEVKKDSLNILQIFADHKVNLETVINSFGHQIRKVKLGFTPYDASGYNIEELYQEDCTLFILGEDLKHIENKKLMFPTLSHA